ISHKLNEDILRTYANTRKIVICHSNLTQFENLPNTHQNLVELYNLRILYQDQYYFTEQDLPLVDFNFDELIKLEQEYFTQLSSAKPSAALEALDNWSQQVETIRFNSLIFFYNKIYIAIYEIFEKRFPNFKVLTISEFENKLNLTQSITSINDYLRNITFQYCNLVQKEKDHKQQQLCRQVQLYISENIQDPELTPDLVANYFDFNSTYLSRLFKQYFDLSISDYILEKRLDAAQQLLVDTDLPVKEISHACGILNTNYFFTLFKKHFGETPTQYRQSYKKT
ncbi:MAG TPA: helix-turn-helix transcriptional regulator, partial [Erysipelothrix sp.]|nr:helix-turn-helix transcriptional regulator [Erysipelothrix sp.]